MLVTSSVPNHYPKYVNLLLCEPLGANLIFNQNSNNGITFEYFIWNRQPFLTAPMCWYCLKVPISSCRSFAQNLSKITSVRFEASLYFGQGVQNEKQIDPVNLHEEALLFNTLHMFSQIATAIPRWLHSLTHESLFPGRLFSAWKLSEINRIPINTKDGQGGVACRVFIFSYP